MKIIRPIKDRDYWVAKSAAGVLASSRGLAALIDHAEANYWAITAIEE